MKYTLLSLLLEIAKLILADKDGDGKPDIFEKKGHDEQIQKTSE